MNPAKFTIGLDLGDRRHTVCVLNEAGDIVTEETLTNTRACLEAFSARFPGATLVMETGTHSPWVSRLLSASIYPRHPCNPRSKNILREPIPIPRHSGMIPYAIH